MSADAGPEAPVENLGEARGEAMLEELRVEPGLCGECVYLRLLRSARSSFVRCALASDDERFPRYPPLPVRVCPGFSPRSDP